MTAVDFKLNQLQIYTIFGCRFLFSTYETYEKPPLRDYLLRTNYYQLINDTIQQTLPHR